MVTTAIHDFAQENRILEFNLQGVANSNRISHFQSQTAARTILHLCGSENFGITEYGDGDSLIQLKTGFAALLHLQRIGGMRGTYRVYCPVFVNRKATTRAAASVSLDALPRLGLPTLGSVIFIQA